MRPRAFLLTIVALTVASLARGSFRELEEISAYANASFDGELEKDCILASGRTSCVNFAKVLNECGSDLVNTSYTVHFLLGPMYGTDALLNDALPAVVGETTARWYVQNRSQWDTALLEVARGRNITYDSFILDPAIVPEMVASGALMNLEPFLATDRWAGQWPGILSALRWQVATTQNVMIPMGASAIVLHYRVDVLGSHSLPVPRTWEQLLMAVHAVHRRPAGPALPADPGFYGFCTMPLAGCHANSYELLALWASFIQTHGPDQGAFFDPDTFTPLVDNDGMRAALLYYRQLATYAPPQDLASISNCSSMFGTAESLYEAGMCAFQLAPHPSYKRNALLSPSAAVRQFSRVAWLPGATSVLDRPTGRLVPCNPVNCPFGATVPLWTGEGAVGAAVLSGDSGAATAAVAAQAAAQPSSSYILASMAPVLGLSPLALGINNFTSLRQKAHSLRWLRRVTDPDTIWKLVVSPSTPLAPFRYEHFSPSNLRYWTDAGYVEADVNDYLTLSYAVLTHGNLLSYPLVVQRILHYRTALHNASYNVITTRQSVEEIMKEMASALATSFGPTVYGYSTLRLQYLLSIGRYDLLAVPPPPPPPSPPEVRYIVGHETRSRDMAPQGAGAAVGGAVGSVAAAALLALAAFLYKRLMVGHGWGRTKDPWIGRETTLVVTDMEASTALWEELEAMVMDMALNLHHETIRRVITQWSGYESVTEGDSFTVAFHSAEAAVGFSLNVQSELMEQPWPPEVLMHEACRPVYVVGAKRLRHLVAKAAAVRPTMVPLQTLEAEAPGASGRSNVLVARSSGTGAVGGGATANAAANGPSRVLPILTHQSSLVRAMRRLDVLSGLSNQLRRSMSFISRPASGSYSARRSLLTVALAGGGSGTSAGSSYRYRAAAAAAGAGDTAYGGGNGGRALAMSGRAATGDSFLLDATAAPCESSALNSSRNLFEHFLPRSGAATPPPLRAFPGSGVAAVAGAAATGSISASLSLGKLPAGLNAANASGIGGTTAAAAGSGFAFSSWTGRPPSVGGRLIVQSSAFRDSGECNDSGSFVLLAEGEAVTGDVPSSGAYGTGVSRLASMAARVAPGNWDHPPPPPQRIPAVLAAASAAATASGLMPCAASTAPRSAQTSHTAQYGIVGSVPEEPSQSPSPSMLRQVVRRTRSTLVAVSSGGGGAGGGDGSGVEDLPVVADPTALRATASGSGMLCNLRSPLKTFLEGSTLASASRRLSRLADSPLPIGRPSPGDGSGLAAPHALPSPSAADYSYGSRPDTRSYSHVATATVVGGGDTLQDSPSFLNELRERQVLGVDAGGPTGRSLRGWRSWTASSLPGFLRRMHRSFRQVAAGASRISFSAAHSGDGGGGGPITVNSAAAETPDAVSRDAVATAAGWEVESQSSSHSHGSPSSMSHGSTIQSTLQLQPSRRDRRGGIAASAGSGGKVLYASPSTYGSELRATWTELPRNMDIDPASVGAVLVFRGFRVRCGMHSGLRTAAEVNRYHPSGRTRYSGPALLCAKAVCDAAHGGMVFASRHTVALCSPQFLTSRVVLWRIGDYVLGNPRLPATLYQLSNTALVLRAALQRPLTRTCMPLGLGLLDAPLSVVACAAIRLASKTLLEEAAPAVSLEAASVLQALSYQYARLHGGYLAQLGVGRALCIFPDAYRAALWAALVARGMAKYPWSQELLTTEHCAARSALDSQGREVQVARGPRVQAVVHFGAVSTLLHPVAGQLSYEGGAVDMTMRILNDLSTIGVVATMEAAASLRRYRPADAARAVALGTGGAGGPNGSNASNGPPPSQQIPSSSRCRTDVDCGVGDVTGSASQRSSAATWREMAASVRQQQQQQLLASHFQYPHHHPHHQLQQQEGLLPRSRSSVERLGSMAGNMSRETGGSSSGGDYCGGGVSPHARVLPHVPPAPRVGGVPSGSYASGRHRVVIPRRASGPILGRGGASSGAAVTSSAGSPDGMLSTAAAAAAGSSSWGRGDDGLRGACATQRTVVPRVASAVIPVGTDSANTSGTDGTDGGTGGGGGSRDSRRDSVADSSGIGGVSTAAARRGSTQQLSLHLGAMSTVRGGATRAPSAGGGDATTSAGDGAARAAALAAAAGGMANDSYLLLLTMSSELPQTCMLAGYAGVGGGLSTAGGGRRDHGTASLSGNNALLGWMISGGVALGSTPTNAMVVNTRHGQLPSNMDSNLVSASDLRPEGSTGAEGSTATTAAAKEDSGKQGGGLGSSRGQISPAAVATPPSTETSAVGAADAVPGLVQNHEQQQQQHEQNVAGDRSSSTVAAGRGGDVEAMLGVDWRIRASRAPLEPVAVEASEGAPCATSPADVPAPAPASMSTASMAATGAAAVVTAAGNRAGSLSEQLNRTRTCTHEAAAAGAKAGELTSQPTVDINSRLPAAGMPSIPLNNSTDCRPPTGGAAASSQQGSSGGLVSPSSPMRHSRGNGRSATAAAAAAAAAEMAAVAVAAAATPSLPSARQSVESVAVSSTQPSDSAEPSSDPEATPSSAAIVLPPPIRRLPQPLQQPQPRQLRGQQSARDSTASGSLGPERVYQSFTFGQRGSTLARPRLQDLLSVSPYTSTASSVATTAASTVAAGGVQPVGSGLGDGGCNRFVGLKDSRGGGGGAAGYDIGVRRGVPTIERSPAVLPSDQSGKAWGADLPSPPSSRTGYSVGQGSSSLEALIRGPHGRMSRSFTFTTHRRSPLAVSSYAGDPEIGATTSGTGGHGAGSVMRPMSSLSRVLYGAGAAVGLVSREAAAAAGGGYDASRETTPRGSSQGPQSAVTAAAAPAAAAAAASTIGGGTGRPGGREPGAVAGTANGGSGAGGISGGGGVQMYRSTSMSRGNRGRRGSLPHPHSGGGPAAAGSLLSGPYGTGSLQPWGNTPTSVVTGVSPFSLTSEYPRSSNSAGTLQISLNSAQLRMSTGELRGVSPDGRGSAGTSPASASAATSPHNMDASVVAIATTAAAAATTTPTRLSADSGGHLSSILARVRGSMGKSRSRSKSLSRTFASTVVPLDAGSSTAARSGGSGQGSVRHDLTALPALGSGDVSGFSARLTSLFPSGSSGGGGGVIAAASRTLRGLTEKLPTLPEGGHAPLMREIRHLELRLIPLRLAARGPRVRGSNAVTATTGQGPVESAACGAPDDGSVRQRHQREQQSYSTGRGTEYMQVYRVTLLAPDVAIQPHAAVQPSPQPSSAQVPNLPPAVAQPGPSLPSPQIQPQQQPQQQPQPEPQRQPHPQPLPPARQGPSPAKQVGHTIAGPKHNPNASTAAASITNQSHAQNRSETDLELVASVPMSGTENCQDDNVSVSVGPRDVLPSGDGGASQSMTGPLLSGGGIMGEVEEASETALVNQFLSGFSDLSDQQLAGLWAAHPERSLLQDRWPANIVQLRTRLVAQAACEEAFARDNFIF